MNPILNVFSKLKTSGEGAAIQLMIAPAGDKFINEFHMILDDVKDGISVKHAADNFYKFNKAVLKVGKELFFGARIRLMSLTTSCRASKPLPIGTANLNGYRGKTTAPGAHSPISQDAIAYCQLWKVMMLMTVSPTR